jgi:hypothetical protein
MRAIIVVAGPIALATWLAHRMAPLLWDLLDVLFP